MREFLNKYPQRWRIVPAAHGRRYDGGHDHRVVAGEGDDAPVIAECPDPAVAGVILGLPLYHATVEVVMALAGRQETTALDAVRALVDSCREMAALIEFVPDLTGTIKPFAMAARARAALAAAAALGVHAGGGRQS